MDNPVISSMNSMRVVLSDNIEEVRTMIEMTKPPVVQELVLAQRALEDARMRITVARTYQQGKDPFVES